ncbi:glycosyltransferase family 4 protein [Microbacterium sp. zg.B48]|uniref:glycosyltransferase family 4 protein n=1 Tax=Microbacterium sp. zg.B48 TaxID=2969408 RepID=UPI00214BFE89|nr:glycosyltransferase family 4 protein [Microbacterium sp. zg.B48]MCR2765130.1 glycosyltransferase family 4 protein [Microbacterium sp. zg.B48]
MRITIVSRIYRPEPASASFFLGSVADALLADGNEVDVLTSRLPRGTAPHARGERVRTFPVIRDRNGYVRGYLPYLSFDIPLAFRLLFARRPDAVLVEPPPTTGAVVRVVCAIRRVPYVYDAADIWSDAADMATGSRAVIRILRAVERFAMRGAAHLVTISQGVTDRMRALDIDRPVTVTGFGADTSEFSVTRAPAEQAFVYAGSYSVWHGADVLLQALAELRTTHPAYTLRVIGNGEREALEALARELELDDAVEFFDAVSPAELAPHLAGAVATLATLKPGTGYDYAFTSKAYSSLAAGCPVIFAGPGPTAAFLNDANGRVRAGAAVAYDPAAIAAAMREFADDPLTVPQREALGAWTAAEHSMAAVARRVAAVIEGVAAATRRKALV